MKSLLQYLSNKKMSVPCLFYPAAKEMGFSVKEILTESDKQAKLLLHIAENYNVSAVVRMTELWCEAAAFGMDVAITDSAFPKLGDPVCDDPEDLQELHVPEVRNKITIPLIDAVKEAAPQMKKPLIVGVTGPYTLGSVLNGSENFMVNCMMEPEIVEDFLNRATDFLTAYILEYKKAGASAVMIAEPSTAMISPDMMEEYSNRYLNRIVEKTADENFAVIYHNCGSVNPHLEVISGLSVDAFHLGSQVDVSKALQLTGKDKLVMGNLEPQLFLGNHEKEIAECKNVLLSLREANPNFILSTGCDLAPGAGMEAIQKAFM